MDNQNPSYQPMNNPPQNAQSSMPPKSSTMPTSLKVVQFLLVIEAVFAVISGLALLSSDFFFGLLDLVSAAVALLLVWGINKRFMWAFYLTIVLFAYSIVSAFFDWQNMFVIGLLLDVVLLYLVVKNRHYFNQVQKLSV